MTQLFSNGARATLSASVAAGDTTLSVASGGALFPVANTGAAAVGGAADWFKAVLDDGAGFEIVYVRTHTSESTSFTNVLRAQEGTTARTFAAGAVMGVRVTAADMQAVAALPAFGTASALNVPASGDAAPGEVVKGSDTRLSDARAPTAHNHDALYFTEAEITAALAAKAALTTNIFTGAQIGTVTALTSTAGSIAINLATNNNFSHTTSENTTLAAPSNPVAGQSGVITITQGATARLLAYNTFWKFPGGTIPTLTATVGAVDVFAYNVESATRATCQLLKDVK